MFILFTATAAFAQALDWETDLNGLVIGAPDTIAGFDGFGDTITHDPVTLVTGICDPVIAAAVAASEVAILAAVPSICDDEIEALVPDMILDAVSALPAPQAFPLFAGAGVEYMEVGQASTASQAQIANQAIFTMHYQEGAAEVYDAVAITITNTPTAGKVMQAALFIDDDGDNIPDEPIWYSSNLGIAGAPTGPKVFTFAAGTWTAAGAAYKDASNNLSLGTGDVVWKTRSSDANNTYRVVESSSTRSLGREIDGALRAYCGFTLNVAPGSLNSGVSGLTAIHTQIPLMVLRRQ